MNIALLNAIHGRKVGAIDFGQQICARSSVNGMELEIYYFLGDSEPIENLLRGFDALRREGSRVLDLVVHGRTTLSSGYFHDIEDLTIQFYVDHQFSEQKHVLVSNYGDLLVVFLPTHLHWREANLGWLEEMFKRTLEERSIVFSKDCTS